MAQDLRYFAPSYSAESASSCVQYDPYGNMMGSSYTESVSVTSLLQQMAEQINDLKFELGELKAREEWARGELLRTRIELKKLYYAGEDQV